MKTQNRLRYLHKHESSNDIVRSNRSTMDANLIRSFTRIMDSFWVFKRLFFLILSHNTSLDDSKLS